MIVFRIFSQYFWAFCIIVTFLNVITIWNWTKAYIKEHPELAQEHSRLLYGYSFWLNVPWIVMGVGCTIGRVPSLWYYFRPRDGNPFVLSWWLSILILYVLTVYWIFFNKGAEKIAKHRIISFYSFDGISYTSNPMTIKLLFLLCIAVGLIVGVVMWIVDLPIPLDLLQAEN